MQLSDKFHNIHWKNLITAVAIPLAVGGLSGLDHQRRHESL